MSAKALTNATPHPTAEQARAAMTGNICRCSGYNHYVDAVVAAGDASAVARGFQPRDRSPERAAPHPSSATAGSAISALTVVGHDTARIDAVERTTGKATYSGDVMLPGMLYGRVLRSPHPHARIRRIDASKALALPGVKADHLARELHGPVGRRVDLRRRAVQRRDQEDHQAPALRVQ
jgi:hypothetical protein